MFEYGYINYLKYVMVVGRDRKALQSVTTAQGPQDGGDAKMDMIGGNPLSHIYCPSYRETVNCEAVNNTDVSFFFC